MLLKLAAFNNPVGYWKYEGPYGVGLAFEEKDKQFPDSVVKNGMVLHIENGDVETVFGTFQFRSEGKLFCPMFTSILVIWDGNGEVRWVNHYHRK